MEEGLSLEEMLKLAKSAENWSYTKGAGENYHAKVGNASIRVNSVVLGICNEIDIVVDNTPAGHYWGISRELQKLRRHARKRAYALEEIRERKKIHKATSHVKNYIT